MRAAEVLSRVFTFSNSWAVVMALEEFFVCRRLMVAMLSRRWRVLDRQFSRMSFKGALNCWRSTESRKSCRNTVSAIRVFMLLRRPSSLCSVLSRISRLSFPSRCRLSEEGSEHLQVAQVKGAAVVEYIVFKYSKYGIVIGQLSFDLVDGKTQFALIFDIVQDHIRFLDLELVVAAGELGRVGKEGGHTPSPGPAGICIVAGRNRCDGEIFLV